MTVRKLQPSRTKDHVDVNHRNLLWDYVRIGVRQRCRRQRAFLLPCHDMTGLVDRGQRVGMDFGVVPFRGDRYVARYLAVSTPEERLTTANRLVRHLP
ncbi:hypothetical protein [Xanthomonas vasicola]|uniref:hypothetical protein n=2 Tax=Xanthomonas vasicola TaxID=56459 RepID=UPI001D085DDB|nr:hypothetical protein [Xanthomonas vasicola]MDO6947404.1 hypothetical protein [Xanthomonas vasicola]MDO6959356.1 hypothetical protein [Xanthomonas vasicola]MDO6968693.1 hypothetical protein [Xanthomonas vasicola]